MSDDRERATGGIYTFYGTQLIQWPVNDRTLQIRVPRDGEALVKIRDPHGPVSVVECLARAQHGAE